MNEGGTSITYVLRDKEIFLYKSQFVPMVDDVVSIYDVLYIVTYRKWTYLHNPYSTFLKVDVGIQELLK